VIAYILFALTGFVFGWAIPGKRAVIVPILIPLLIALPTAMKEGADGRFLVDLFVALLVTVIGIVVGRIVAGRSGSGQAETVEG
jgi:hypothetical protein